MVKNEVNSVKKALAILDLFPINGPELSISEISEKLGLPRPTVSRLVNTLVGEGYLKRITKSRKYSLGIKLFRLSTVINSSMKITTVAAPLLRELRDNIGETVYLDILDGYERVCVLSFEGKQLLRIVVPIGQRSLLYAGADAKAILAYQPENVIDEIVDKTGLKPFSKNTITDATALKQELIKIKQEGVAVSIAECTPGSVAVSCPVWDQNGEVTSSVSISLPHARLTDELLDRYVKKLKKVAYLISKQVGADEKMIKLYGGDL